MDLKALLEALSLGNVTAIVLVVLTVIQIAPIKIDPWSWVGKAIGRFINGEVLERQKNLEEEVGDLKDQIKKSNEEAKQNKVELARKRILRFNDELLHDQNHSKEMFDDILEDIELYENYYKTHDKVKNGKAKHAVQNINSVYDKRLEKRDFL